MKHPKKGVWDDLTEWLLFAGLGAVMGALAGIWAAAALFLAAILVMRHKAGKGPRNDEKKGRGQDSPKSETDA